MNITIISLALLAIVCGCRLYFSKNGKIQFLAAIEGIAIIIVIVTTQIN
ncbi:MAG: hypothetical protein ACNFW9_01640 [Candidatus Kerfeldbacteria bacterium]